MTIFFYLSLLFLLLYIITLFLPTEPQNPATVVFALTWYAFLVSAVIFIYLHWSSIIITLLAILALYILQFILQAIAGSLIYHKKKHRL